MYLVSLGIERAKQVLIADGAEWIWKHVPFARTQAASPETYQILDFYHVTEHLQALLMPLFSQDTERKKMVQASPVLPKRGKKSLPYLSK